MIPCITPSFGHNILLFATGPIGDIPTTPRHVISPKTQPSNNVSFTYPFGMKDSIWYMVAPQILKCSFFWLKEYNYTLPGDMDVLSPKDEVNGLIHSEEFPLPESILETNFKQFDSENIDEFLFQHHRYTSIDILMKELSQLSQSLNQNLLDLVNHDYNDFITLGKSINNSHDNIYTILNDLANFKTDLSSISHNFDLTIDQVNNIIAHRKALVKIKTLAKISLILSRQVDNFEIALENNKNNYSLSQLTGFYLSITNLFNYLSTSSVPPTEKNPFISNYLSHKISSLKLEFLAHLQNLMKNAKLTGDSDNVLLLLNIYKLIGHESDALRALTSKS